MCTGTHLWYIVWCIRLRIFLSRKLEKCWDEVATIFLANIHLKTMIFWPFTYQCKAPEDLSVCHTYRYRHPPGGTGMKGLFKIVKISIGRGGGGEAANPLYIALNSLVWATFGWGAGMQVGGGHRVGRVLSLFSSRWNWDSPNPSPAREWAPPNLWFRGRGTLAGERRGGRVPIPTRGHTA